MKINGKHYRSVWPIGEDAFGIIDQTRLPHEFVTLTLRSAEDAAHAIKTMQTRGAPLIGAVAAYGLALAVREDASDDHLQENVAMLEETRPTAINLKWALWRMRGALLNQPHERRVALAWTEAARIADEDVAMCEAIGWNGLKIIEQIAASKPGKTINILTHCNAGWLATVDYGTALAPIYMAHDAGIPLHVWVDETRPRNQGASLTAFELGSHGVDHTIVADNAGGHYMQAGQVDLVIVGTDRVTANGDVANKIGTYLKALAAKDNGVPFYVALPSSTLDWTLASGAEIPIEQRSEDEVLKMTGRLGDGTIATVEIAAPGSGAANPGFDVTPARLVTGFITERGTCAATPEGLTSLFSQSLTAHLRGEGEGTAILDRTTIMQSRWNDTEAQDFVSRYAKRGVNEDLALRTYTTRLLGSDPRLVLHGGGNTSVKTTAKDMLGEDVEVIHIKGSGWDMGNIEPAGLPAVRLAPLRRLRALDKLSDEDMVNFQRINLLDSAAPNPSVETLLHAFLPHKFIDHTHSTAVLALTDQPDGEAVVREVYGDRVAYVPYTIPGFALAKSVADVFDKNPHVEGLVLLQHGIFTVGDDARQAYGRMIDFVTMAEERLGRQRKMRSAAKLPANIARLAEIAPILRGAVALQKNATAGTAKRQILNFRNSPAIMAYVNGADLARYSQQGVVTPDHTIRTKNWPLVVPAPEAGKLDEWSRAVHEEVDAFVARYHDYFARNNAKSPQKKKELDPFPRVILVPGLGMFGVGASAKDAAIASDIAENTVEVISDAEAIGEYKPIGEFDMFEVEYWSLEQAKLGKSAEKALARQVAVVTGGGSGIGAATAKAFAAQGAEVAILDRDLDAAKAVAKKIGGKALVVQCDVTDPMSVRAAFDAVAAAFGGVDVVVSNAGAAWQGTIGKVDDETLRKSFELNFWAHQSVAQNAVRIMTAQGTFGGLLFNTSKQAVNPGKDFGPYGLPKAATLFLVKQYALDHGKDGIRANAVNADRIRTGLLTDEMVAARSKARGVSEADYMSGNLLKREVTAEDVADAFVYLATATKTTAAVITVDGGNIEASLR